MAFQFVTKTTGVPTWSGKVFDVEGHKVAVFNLDGDFYAIDDICTHEEASLAEGVIMDKENVECPWHGAMFSIKTGAAMTMPAVTPVRTYAVKVEGDNVMIDVTAEASTKVGG